MRMPPSARKFWKRWGQGQHLFLAQGQLFRAHPLLDERHAHLHVRLLEANHQPAFQPGAQGGKKILPGPYAVLAGENHLAAAVLELVEQHQQFLLQRFGPGQGVDVVHQQEAMLAHMAARGQRVRSGKQGAQALPGGHQDVRQGVGLGYLVGDGLQ